ncbi:MAG: hypothetical protein JJE22_05835 [Bacteroidia bacterium]|nr:hypothetical protein [Bacteroidia bacterium]
MKKLLVLTALAALTACNNDAKDESMKSDSDSTIQASVTYPYDIMYSSKFEMADPKYGQMILQLWKDWDNADLSAHKDNFADSVELHFADGSMLHNVRDSVIASAQSYRNTFASAASRVDAVTSLKSTDKDQNWALVWGMETDTDKMGKVDSFYLQETWRFNSAGKVDLLYQFKAAGAPPK